MCSVLLTLSEFLLEIFVLQKVIGYLFIILYCVVIMIIIGFLHIIFCQLEFLYRLKCFIFHWKSNRAKYFHIFYFLVEIRIYSPVYSLWFFEIFNFSIVLFWWWPDSPKLYLFWWFHGGDPLRAIILIPRWRQKHTYILQLTININQFMVLIWDFDLFWFLWKLFFVE